MVPARFVKCANFDTIQDIIKYNNSQNRISTSDFRSNDGIQKRLVEEFKVITGIKYNGGRRGGSQDIIKRNPNLLSADTVAQSLFAFHDNPIVAYNSKSEIWANNSYYSRIFNEATTARHIILVYSLLRAIENKKKQLMDGRTNGTLKMHEEEQLQFLRAKGSIYLFLSAISRCMEIIIDKKIPNKFELAFNKKMTLDECIQSWKTVVDGTLPFHSQFFDITQKGMKSQEEVNKAIRSFVSMVNSIHSNNSKIFSEFVKCVNK